MKVKNSTQKRGPVAETGKTFGSTPARAGIPSPEELVQEAMQEEKRMLLMEHIGAIKVLRDQKTFTFRAIADWLSERGIKVDHSAVYRAYLAAIPSNERYPDVDWSEVDEPGYGDVEVKKK